MAEAPKHFEDSQLEGFYGELSEKYGEKIINVEEILREALNSFDTNIHTKGLILNEMEEKLGPNHRETIRRKKQLENVTVIRDKVETILELYKQTMLAKNPPDLKNQS